MSTLSNEIISDDEIPNVEIPNVEIPNVHQESVTASSSTSVKKRISPIYNHFTFGNDERWHCKYCR
jgi:hypothetical protein